LAGKNLFVIIVRLTPLQLRAQRVQASLTELPSFIVAIEQKPYPSLHEFVEATANTVTLGLSMCSRRNNRCNNRCNNRFTQTPSNDRKNFQPINEKTLTDAIFDNDATIHAGIKLSLHEPLLKHSAERGNYPFVSP